MSFKDVILRRKLYGFIFMGSGLLLGAVGLFVMWAPDMINGTMLKLSLTFLLTLCLSSVLFVLTFTGDDEKLSKKIVYLIGACALALSAILISEIWFDIFEDTMLGKIIITLSVVAGLAAFVLAVWDDFFENKRLKDENYLD